MAVLVIAEHDGKQLKPGVANTVTGAAKMGGDVTVLVVGHQCAEAAQAAAKVAGVKKVLHCDAPHYDGFVAENMAALIVPLAPQYTHIVAPATDVRQELHAARRGAARRAADLRHQRRRSRPIPSCGRSTPAMRSLTVQSSDKIKVVTVRGTAFDPAGESASPAPVETLAPGPRAALSKFNGQEVAKSERPELTAARIIVSGGRGMGSAENFQIIEALADKLGAAVGASRAAVDSGFKPNEFQVGQTGKIVAPELYIAVGISGAIQHLAGMKDSKVIVAINKDPEAPIFAVADYWLVEDLFKAVPELTKEL